MLRRDDIKSRFLEAPGGLTNVLALTGAEEVSLRKCVSRYIHRRGCVLSLELFSVTLTLFRVLVRWYFSFHHFLSALTASLPGRISKPWSHTHNSLNLLSTPPAVLEWCRDTGRDSAEGF